MPLAAVTPAGWDRVSRGSTTAIVGRSRGWLMPLLTCWSSTSRTQTVVLSLPVPVVVGTATSGASGVSGCAALADRGVHVVEQVAGVGAEQVDRLGGVDRGSAADRDEGVPRPAVAGELDGLDHARVGGLDVRPVEQHRLDAGGLDLLGDPLRVAGRRDARGR